MPTPVAAASSVEPFGTVIGHAPGGVPVYSSDYGSADDEQLPDRHAYRSYVDGIYMGHKSQCVEFARRSLYLNKGYIFDVVAMAYDIFELTSVRCIAGNTLAPLRSFRNGAQRPPEPGCLLIWDEGGEFEGLRVQLRLGLLSHGSGQGAGEVGPTLRLPRRSRFRRAPARGAASCVRVDTSRVINQDSQIVALRVVDDEEILEG